MGGHVTFLHVVRPDQWITTRSGSAPRAVRMPARDDQVLAEAVERAAARSVPAACERIEGEEVRTILAEADAIDADVVVVGRGRRRPKVRSVSKSVVRRAGRTVFVARAT
jgi:nucleotide-binding universal stress UspA family protein